MIQHKRKVAIETHGCKLNQADSQGLAKMLRAKGFTITNLEDDVDVYILNTCTVTHVADRKARQAIRKAKKRNEDSIIIVTGCYVQRDPSKFEEINEVDLIINNSNKETIADSVASMFEDSIDHVNIYDHLELSSRQLEYEAVRTRAMLKIQEGCNQVCAYCIVPKVRGKELSIDPEQLIASVITLEDMGYQEVVLTGTQLGSYGFDIPGYNLVRLLTEILKNTSIPRIRVSSLQAHEIDTELLSLWSDRRLCQHFHVPLQSGSDNVLKRMRRRYTAAEFSEAIDLIQQNIPNAGITTDVIVGFPGESDEEFNETLTMCDTVNFSSMHIFPYSKRPSTSAYYFNDQVRTSVKNYRSNILLSLAKEKERIFSAAMTGIRHRVLWEKLIEVQGYNAWSGLTENYLRVFCANKTDMHNSITEESVTRDTTGFLWVSNQ
jgi:threonylcarbamoyladenosine tRNA methylthiotransferase MtaB